MKYTRGMFVNYRVINGKKMVICNYNVFELDEIGEIIWNSLDGKKTVEEITDEISRKYNVAYETVFSDTTSFIKELETNGLVEEVLNE